ncbi:ABC transporter permease subunit [Chloracidobacterium aggregatum]|uniref:ABC transporter permease subunit n=1 Tax=Chloracidobacterium sp. N TaxID=2821540 RepID=A0ABX8B6I2_9BACT|nr:ABC transporter permease subunit [Chloracidobacterium aggregatum]QUV86302.1 ABC transporter permease subunit [Chloracidobacterium sp. 2]QUV89271.1 ABC transporter permease subunit [Chloracidobacterium sp. S]QUV92725.1 ABC transporter permease subunit [Chloracidobacterium sp. A]QUV95201.1 ABC transporter permease subunit [Chloracidobacterium sp. N]QUV98412.1 ABC transporter permease subunit [Chloracidobacterium sp. E]
MMHSKLWLSVFRHEWRHLLREKSLWLVGLVLPGLCVFGAYNGLRWTTFQQTASAAFQKSADERLAAYRETVAGLEQKQAPDREFDPRRPLIAGMFRVFQPALLPPAPLATFAIGDRDLRPYAFRITMREAAVQPDPENPLHAATGWFDIAFVVTFLLPLMVFAFGYDVLSGERERGTLALVLAQPITPFALLVTKLAARGVWLVGTMWGAGLLAFLLTEGPSGAALLRLVLWMGLVAVYVWLWLAVVAVVAAGGWASATNAVVLSVVWLVWGLLIPAAGAGVANGLAPGPSPIELVNARRSADRAFEANEKELTARYLAAQGVPTALPAEDFSMQALAHQAAMESELRPLREAGEQARRRRHQWRARLAWLSPTALMQSLLDGLSGVDADRWLAFYDQVLAFHETWRERFARRVLSNDLIRAEEVPTWPRFTLREPPLSALYPRLALAGGLWLGLGGVLLWVAGTRTGSAGILARP